MKAHKNIGGSDFHGTCSETGKRQYSSRGHARKARQIHSHTRGTPYRCPYCGYFHIGRYKSRKTRDGYRPRPTQIEVETLARQLGVSASATRLALKELGIPLSDGHVPLEALNQLKTLTYREP